MIDLLFILLNFSIVLGLLIYGAKRYLLPTLKSKVEEERAVEQNLHDEHHQLLITQKQVDESLVAQEADCTDFLHKINQWREVVHSSKSQREADSRHLLEEASKKVLLQSQYHKLKAVYQKVTPFVVKELEEEAKSHFANESAAHSYLHHVLNDLKK